MIEAKQFHSKSLIITLWEGLPGDSGDYKEWVFPKTRNMIFILEGSLVVDFSDGTQGTYSQGEWLPDGTPEYFCTGIANVITNFKAACISFRVGHDFGWQKQVINFRAGETFTLEKKERAQALFVANGRIRVNDTILESPKVGNIEGGKVVSVEAVTDCTLINLIQPE